MSDELVAFLRARLNEDAEMVRRNTHQDKELPGGMKTCAGVDGLAHGYPDYQTYTSEDTDAADAYIAHFGPERILAEIESKREIIRTTWNSDGGTIRRLAAVYADHPDYREEWRPRVTLSRSPATSAR